MSYPPLKRKDQPVAWNTATELHPNPNIDYSEAEILLRPDQFDSDEEHRHWEGTARNYLRSLRGLPRSETQQPPPNASAAERLSYQRSLVRQEKRRRAAEKLIH